MPDKGKVEALVKYSRVNFLTPVPHAASFDALNATLEERCRARQAECAGRHEQTIGERLAADRGAFRRLPTEPFEPCGKRPAKVSSTALVRYRMNDYFVPTAYGFRDVLVKGFAAEGVIICGANEIARHPRIYDRGQFVFDPKHYLALLEQKPGALDQAAPLQSWTLPEPLQHLRRLLEARMGNRGNREFIQVLRLMEVFPETIVTVAALDAIRLGAVSFDAVKQLVIAKIERISIPAIIPICPPPTSRRPRPPIPWFSSPGERRDGVGSSREPGAAAGVTRASSAPAQTANLPARI